MNTTFSHSLEKNGLTYHLSLKCSQCAEIPFEAFLNEENKVLCSRCAENAMDDSNASLESDEIVNYYLDLHFGKMLCPNGCPIKIYRSDRSSCEDFDFWQQHYFVCPNREVKCIYSDCKEKIKVSDYKIHLKHECKFNYQFCEFCKVPVHKFFKTFPICGNCNAGMTKKYY